MMWSEDEVIVGSLRETDSWHKTEYLVMDSSPKKGKEIECRRIFSLYSEEGKEKGKSGYILLPPPLHLPCHAAI